MRNLINNTFFSETAHTHTAPESTFATISVFAPVFGFLFVTTADTRSDIETLVLVGATVVIGIIAAIAAWVRREKSLSLRITAFALNAILLLCLLLMLACYLDPE